MSDKRRFEAFDVTEMERYKEEAKRRYGAAMVEESYQRVARMTKEEQAGLADDFDDVCRRLVSCVGGAVDTEEVRGAMETLRAYLNRFYDCTPEIFRGLGTLYCSDERFRERIASFHPELSEFMCKAMAAYADALRQLS